MKPAAELPLDDKKEISTVTEQPNQVVQTVSEEGQFMNLIAQMMQDKDADMAKLEKLLALRDQEKAARAKHAFDKDFVAMKPNLPRVIKLHMNNHTKSKFVKLEDVNDVINPILGKFGFGTASKVIKQTDKDVTMLLEVRHTHGHYDIQELTMPIDNVGAGGTVNKTTIQGIASTITQIKKVGFCAMLNISTGDDNDGNANGAQGNITIEQAADFDVRLRALSDVALGNFLKWAKIDALTDISVRDHQRFMKALVDMEANAKKAAKQ